MKIIQRKTLLILTAVLAGWAFDLLFWERRPGVSVLIYVVILLAGLFVLAWRERVRVSAWSLVLVPPILFFATMLFMRQEPMTIFVSGLMLAVLMLGLALSLSSGLWPRFSLTDWLVGSLRLTAGAFAGVFPLFPRKTKMMDGAGLAKTSEATVHPKTAWPVVRSILIGLLIALPVLVVFGSLLAMADPVFNDLLTRFFKNWSEYVWRLVYILTLAYLLAGVYLFSLTRGRETRLIGAEKPWMPAFLGGVEAGTVLACVDLLFALFVGVQFAYFFGGQTNINIEGYTYAQYARKGFMELVWVAFLSLLLFLSLNAVTRRSNRLHKWLFSGLGIGLVALVGVILLSAYYRLNLYESVYGFSRIRTYVHVFMVWLGLLLLATIALELLGKTRWFALALLMTAVGFGASLSLLNVDGFIARQNVPHLAETQDPGRRVAMDQNYLLTLSTDAVPAMVTRYQRLEAGETRDSLGAVLACKKWQLQREEPQSWPSYRTSPVRAWQALAAVEGELTKYTPVNEGYSKYVIKGQNRYFCEGYSMD